jgi:hypothetical protein
MHNEGDKNMITWNDIFTQGTLIDFSVHLWRARIQLTASDLGIDPTEDVTAALSFGCHRLAPAKAFEQINTIVRQWQKAIEEHSLNFPLLNGVRYVPDDQITELQQKLEREQRAFNQAVQDFIDDYNNIQEEMIPVLKSALYEAAKDEVSAEAAVDRVISEYPSAKRISEKFGLEWNFFNISLPTSQDAVKTAKSAVPQVKRVIESMVTELRKELSGKVETLLTLITKVQSGQSRAKEGLGKKSVDSALAVLNKVDRLNILDDPVLREQTNVLKSLLNSANMDTTSISQELSNVKKSLTKDVAEAAEAAEKRLTGLGKRKLSL